ncbi:MAG TPA: NADH-quinone oxidoreductase subunit A [bacterium]|nr:NADH-quinone oxidoreductase subunit A [bacterium]
MSEYLPIFILLLLATGFALGTIVLSYFVGQKTYEKIKLSAYECGMEPVGDARLRFSVKFYLIAMLFILFDVETVFLYPWAVVFADLRWFGFIEMVVFIGILLLSFVYLWKRGAFDWE